MFSRRHPYLFFLLSLTAIGSATLLILTLLIAFAWNRGAHSMVKGQGVGVVRVEGPIVDATRCMEELKNFRTNKAVKAIVLRIDSPGGGVGPSQEIYREVLKTREVKPVIASMGGVAASGGYYVAAAATGIMASPGTVTGSIGVIMGYTNVEELLSKLGLVPVVIKSGKLKDAGSPLRPMSDEERQFLSDLASRLHRQFIGDIAKARNMEESRVSAVADGRILSGAGAAELGLVDRMGNLEDAVEWAGREGGIEGEIAVVHARKPKIPWIDYVLEEGARMFSRELGDGSLRIEYRMDGYAE